MARDVFKTLDNLAEEIGSLRKQLHGLYSAFGAAVTPSRRVRRKVRKVVRKAALKARKAASPKLKAMRKVQGQYMGYVRRLTSVQKAQVKKVRESKGYQAAIKLAKGMGK